MKKNTLENRLTTHEIEFLKKIGEYDDIKAGFEIMELVKQIPDDVSAFFERFDKEVSTNPSKFESSLRKIAKEDPVFFKQIMAFYTLLGDLSPSNPSVEKISKHQLEQETKKEAMEIIIKKFKSI